MNKICNCRKADGVKECECKKPIQDQSCDSSDTDLNDFLDDVKVSESTTTPCPFSPNECTCNKNKTE